MYLRFSVCAVLACSFACLSARGQLQHFEPISNTGENATLVLPESTNPSIDGVAFTVGDEVGVFSPGGLTVGAGAWSGTNLAITVWGDDSITPEIDGMLSGDTLLIRVWDQSADKELDDVVVTYSGANGFYEPNAILTLTSLEAHTTLPVELTGFRATIDAGDVLVRWQTSSEHNNAGFEIQRRRDADASQWYPAVFVAGHQTDLEETVYEYRLKDLEPGAYLIRLRQIDLDGSYSFSSVLRITIPAPSGFLLYSAYPNPSRSVVTIGFRMPRQEHAILSLVDSIGREVILIRRALEPGIQQIQVNVEALPSGVYFYRLQAGDYVDTKRMAVVK